MELTLFEIHLDDASFKANAPYSGRSPADSEESIDEESAAGEESGRPSFLPFLVGLAALAGLAYFVRRLRGNGDDLGTEIEPEIAEPETPTP